MKRIFKYELSPFTRQIRMPKGAEILTLQVKRGDNTPKDDVPYIWAIVDDLQQMVLRQLSIAPTGSVLQDNESSEAYIGTFQVVESGITTVFHVFDGGEL